jgi:hypothetical protein
VDTKVERRAQIQSPPDEESGFTGLRDVEFVLWAVIATATLRRVRTKAGIAEFLAPKCPMDEVSEGGLLRPLPR